MRFTRDHQWIDLRGDVAVVGVTAYAAKHLGPIVHVALVAAGKALKAGDGMAMVEGVKAASDIYAPVDGEVIAVNAALPGAPGMINDDPENAGWIVKMTVYDPAQVETLMDRFAYQAFVGQS